MSLPTLTFSIYAGLDGAATVLARLSGFCFTITTTKGLSFDAELVAVNDAGDRVSVLTYDREKGYYAHPGSLPIARIATLTYL